MKKIWLILAILMIGGYADAVIITKTLDVSANVQQSVSLDVTEDICFGEYDGSQNNVEGEIRVTRQSTDTAVLSIKLSEGAAGTFTPRCMGGQLDYNLYRDSARTEIWGDGLSGTYYQDIPVGGTLVNLFTVYGRIPASQSVSAAAYTDLITVTVEY